MGTVGAPAHFGSPVDLDVVDHETVNVQTLVVSIALSVTKQLPQKLSALLWPAALSAAKSLSLGFTTNATVEPTERHDLFLRNDVLQVALGPAQRHVLDGLCRLPCVLEVHPEVGAPCLARLGCIIRIDRVPPHHDRTSMSRCVSHRSNRSLSAYPVNEPPAGHRTHDRTEEIGWAICRKAETAGRNELRV